MIRSYVHPTLGEVRYPPSPVKFGNREVPNEPAPMLGEHTFEVLSGRLGMSASDIQALAREQIVKIWPDPGGG
jgi:crotonobetainyl-CoA:carnitine CoA-transferase CaiB-like acyl-CoA transferase